MFKPGNSHVRRSTAACCTALLSLCWAGSTTAGTTFDVIGPGEYDLPVDFDPFNVFVQYATVQDNDKVRDADGDKVDGDGSQQIQLDQIDVGYTYTSSGGSYSQSVDTAVSPDMADNVFIAWEAYTTDYDIFLQKVDTAGSVVWANDIRVNPEATLTLDIEAICH